MEQILKNREEQRKQFYLQTFRKIIFKDQLTQEDRKLFKFWVENYHPNMTMFSHFTNKNILFELVKSLGNSELIINEDIRWLYSAKIDYLIYNLYFYKVMEYKGESPKGEIHGLQLYRGLAGFKERPQAPYNPAEKKKWQNEVWTGGEMQFSKKVDSYSFGLDIDGKDLKDSYKDALKVFNFFKKFNIKFLVQSSGKKGWHFLIPFEEFSNLIGDFELEKTVNACRGLMEDLVKHLKLKKVDTLIYSPTRYLKLPWSIDGRNNRLILPLSDTEFVGFLENMDKYTSIEYAHSLPNLGFIGEFRGRQSNKKGMEEIGS